MEPNIIDLEDGSVDEALGEEVLAELRLMFRKRVEAGVMPEADEWDEWTTVTQNIWLEQKQRVKELDLAVFLKLLLEQLKFGRVAEDMAYDELDEEQQSAIMAGRTHQEAMLARLKGH